MVTGDEVFYIDQVTLKEYEDLGIPPIPLSRFYIEAETYDGFIFQKGFPENETPDGDIYDKDPVLDIIGKNFGVPRRKFKETIFESDYEDTIPPYNNSLYEWDYFYQNRIIQHMEELPTRKLIELELENYLGITPIVSGRWRLVAKMDHDDQNTKIMQTPEYNGSVFDIFASIPSIPSNINLEGNDIQDIIRRAFPLSKRAYFTVTDESMEPNLVSGLNDYIAMSIFFDPDILGISESITAEVDTDYLSQPAGLVDWVHFDNNWLEDALGFQDRITAIQKNTVALIDTDAEYNAGTHSSTYASSNRCYVSESAGNASGYPHSYTILTADKPGSWVNPANICDQDNDEASHDVDSYNYTERILLKNFGFSIPAGAIITGVWVGVVRRQSGTIDVHDHYVVLSKDGTGWGSSNKATTTKWPNSLAWANYGGSGDLWGLSLSRDDVNSSNFGVMLQAHNNSGYYPTVYVARVSMSVDYVTIYGEWLSQTISTDVNGTSWDTFKASYYLPGAAGMNYEIRRASDNALLKSWLPSNGVEVDISDIQYTNIKVKAAMSSTSRSAIPYVQSVTVKNKKQVTL